MRSERFTKGFLTVVLGCILAVTLASSSWSQPAYPTKPINLYIPYSPGGVGDISVRFMATKAEKILGQPFIVTNNGAGAGSVAFAIVAGKPADGYTILGGGNSAFTRIPQFRTVPYKPDDLTPIMHFATPALTPIVVKSTSPWKTFKELVDYAKEESRQSDLQLHGCGISHASCHGVCGKAGWDYLDSYSLSGRYAGFYRSYWVIMCKSMPVPVRAFPISKTAPYVFLQI